MSVDGFMAGTDISAAEPMGRGGARLHEWIFADNEVDKGVIADTFAAVGAVVLGRRTFDVGLDEWGDTPYPAPSFVVTHRPEPDRAMKSASFTLRHRRHRQRAWCGLGPPLATRTSW